MCRYFSRNRREETAVLSREILPPPPVTLDVTQCMMVRPSRHCCRRSRTRERIYTRDGAAVSLGGTD